MAGIVGVEPWRLTFRQLSEMATAKLESNWDETATILAMIHNVNCAKKYDHKPPDYFHPYHRRRAPALQLTPQQSVRMLSKLLVQR